MESTNRKINNLLASVPDEKQKQYKRHARVTTIDEIQAFLGLILYRGPYSLNTFFIEKLFSDQYGPPISSSTMSCSRL